jgi:hypothetical protein
LIWRQGFYQFSKMPPSIGGSLRPRFTRFTAADFHFDLNSDQRTDIPKPSLRAINGLMRRNKKKDRLAAVLCISDLCSRLCRDLLSLPAPRDTIDSSPSMLSLGNASLTLVN